MLTKVCLAQKGTNTDDVYGGKANKKNIAITDDLSFSVDDFVKGYMILPSDALQYGYLRFNGNKVIFKDSVTSKTTRYGAEEIKGFVCDIVDSLRSKLVSIWNGTGSPDMITEDPNKTRFFSRGTEGFLKADTFKVYLHTYEAIQDRHMASFGKKMITDKLFVKVLVCGPALTLYKRVETRRSGMGAAGISYDVNIFYLKRPGETQYTELPSGNRPFKKLMADYLKDDPKLIDDIKNEALGYDNLDKIVARYNNKN